MGGVIHRVGLWFRRRPIFTTVALMTIVVIPGYLTLQHQSDEIDAQAQATTELVQTVETASAEAAHRQCVADNEVRAALRRSEQVDVDSWTVFLALIADNHPLPVEEVVALFDARVIGPHRELAAIDGPYAPRDCG